MERFLKNLKEHALKIINYEKKEIIPLTYEENRSYKKQKVCYIYKQGCNTNKNDKNVFLYTIKKEIIVIILENIEGLLITFVIEDIKYQAKFP